jgi:hypothetical protein
MRLQKYLATVGLVLGGVFASTPVLAASLDAGSLVSMGAPPLARVPKVNVRTLVVPPPQPCVRETRPVTDDVRAADGGIDWKRLSPTPPQFSPAAPEPPDLSQRWGTTVAELFYFNAIGHTVRMLQQRTRVELKGPFLKEWLQSAKPVFTNPHWDDEGSFSINYIGHSMSGAAYGMIQRQNHGRAWNAPFGSSEYWGNIPLSMFVSFVASFQFEVGPISEASLGNVGMNPVKQGYVDLVVTPVLGMAWMIGQDAFDKYVMTKIENKITNKPWRATIRIVTDLPRTMTNLMAGRAPWYRQDRPLGSRR